jgi:acetyl esterase/lipase
MNPRSNVRSDLWARARWLKRARLADYLMAVGESSAALPVVGKHLKPLGSVTALSAWGHRHAPSFVSSMIRDLGSRDTELRRQNRERTPEVSVAALRGIVPAEQLEIDWPPPDRLPPVLRYREHRRQYLHRSSVPYGDAPEQHLDVWRRADLPAEPAPVLVFVPGGAWVHGSRSMQGNALLSHLAAQGWVCVSIDYRVAPHHRWPRHIHDVKAAVAWTRANIDQFGGDPNFVAIAGCSAGGHLAALAGLTADDPGLHPELPAGADTSVDAVVGMYGRYDWEDRSTVERESFMSFLERVVVKKRYERHPELFRAASPIARVHCDAPPFLVVHGSADSLVPVAQASAFVDRLRATSRASVGYLELPGAGHAFDMTDGARTASAVTAIGLFLNEIHRSHRASQAKQVV